MGAEPWRDSGITGLCHVAMVSLFMYIYMLSIYRGGGGDSPHTSVHTCIRESGNISASTGPSH